MIRFMLLLDSLTDLCSSLKKLGSRLLILKGEPSDTATPHSIASSVQDSKVSHWSVHKEECARLEQQMEMVDVINDFPFIFSEEATYKICENQETRCSFLSKRGIHRVRMWTYECSCGAQVYFESQRFCNSWDLPSTSCPCKRPISPLSENLAGWEDYYSWRNIPLHSPVSLLLQWMVMLKVSMHCNGCARKVEKHISKMDGNYWISMH